MSAEIAYVFGCISTLIASFVLAIFAPCPRHCASGFYVDGVRPSGSFGCHRIPARRIEEDREPRPYIVMPDLPGEDFEYRDQIYCTGGAHPIVVDFRTVGCQR